MNKPLEQEVITAIKKLEDPKWRLYSGSLYKIVIKGDDNNSFMEDLIANFVPNEAQDKFLKRLHYRNIILKARQLGMTTLIAIMWLDFALFNPNVNCGIIAQDDEKAKKIFKDKVKFAYDHLPEFIKRAVAIKTDNAHEITFTNGSSIRVASSMRSGTYHRLHVSELGKISAISPKKADEVLTGSIPTVPNNGILVIESTAEGRDGIFFKLTQAAIALYRSGKKVTQKDYRFHFFGWFDDKNYRLDDENILITEKDNDYFDSVEATMKVNLDRQQRAWYVATRKGFEDAGKEEKVLQEFPSTSEEAFQRSVEGTYYVKEMAKMRKEGRICHIPVLESPCNTFWDIGGTAGTAIWIIQTIGVQDRAVGYIEAHNESYGYFVRALYEKGLIFNKHFMPHDAGHKHQGKDVNQSPKDMFEALGLINIEIVPVITNLDVGIQLTKKHMAGLWIDEKKCAKGIDRVDGYKRKWDSGQGRFREEPEKNDGNSEGADALRQWAQAKELGMITTRGDTPLKKTKGNWRTV